MSTRGSFIIRKNGKDKELYIPADSYPSSAGRDVVRLIKSLDLSNLYNLLKTEDDLFEAGDISLGEPFDFSLDALVKAYREEKTYFYKQTGEWFIQDSMMCEYAYLIDLDEKQLQFYIGEQKEQQDGNRYGTDQWKGYYPCALKAVFNFAFVKQNATPGIVILMEEAAEKEEIQHYEAEAHETAEVSGPKDMRQLIIARKDLQMSAGKLAAQVSHASMAFLTCAIKENHKEVLDCGCANAWQRSRLLKPWDDDDRLEPAQYRRMDLQKWTTEARERGEKQIYFEPVNPDDPYGELRLCEKKFHIESTVSFDTDMYEQWINGAFTKVILQARNKNKLKKAKLVTKGFGRRLIRLNRLQGRIEACALMAGIFRLLRTGTSS